MTAAKPAEHAGRAGPAGPVGVGGAIAIEEPVRVTDLVTRVTAANPGMMTGPGTNTYVVGIDEVVVIDAGPDDAKHRAATLAAIGGRAVTAVVCTHHHPDHASGSAPLARAVGAPVRAHPHEAGPPVDDPLADGDRVGPLIAVHTPGHASDHMCLLLETERALFSGDHVMNGSTVVIGPPDGHMRTYLSSLRRVLDLGVTRIYPGHGQVITDAAAAVNEYLTHRELRRQQVLDRLTAGDRTAGAIVAALYSEVRSELHPVAARTVTAHLEQLVEDGDARVESFSEDGTPSGWAPAPPSRRR